MKTVIFTHLAAKEFDKLPKEVRLSFEQAISGYILYGQGDVLKLNGRSGYRMRVGDYRMIFEIEGDHLIALYFGHRQTNTYKR